MSKKTFSLVLVAAMLFSLSACRSKNKPVDSETTEGTGYIVSDISEDSDLESETDSDVSDTDSASGDMLTSGDALTVGAGDNTGTNTNSNSNSTHSNNSGTPSKSNTSNPSSSSDQAPDDYIAIFGGESDPNRAKLKTMGQQGWYEMYSTKTNVNTATGSFDLNSLKECKLTIAGLWKPNESLTDKDGNALNGSWFAIRKDGFICGDTAFTAALKWVCPYDGTYKVSISYSGGSSDGYAAEDHYEGTGDKQFFVPAADGVYMSGYINNQKVFGLDTWACANHRADQTDKVFDNQKLKKGQTVILVADPKGNGGWDDPWWYASAERTGN